MKIKITLIAFLASAMMFTSCMKNESSPGIESVREAYASLLLAKAQAEVILANAQATFINAEAAVQESIAAMNDATAAATAATSDDEAAAAAQAILLAQATLAQQLITWAQANAIADAAAQTALDAYELAVLNAKNDLVADYYLKYTQSLTKMRAAQAAIFAKNTLIFDLAIDLINGTMNTMPGLVATLDTKTAELGALETELETAKTLLGNVDAINARIAELLEEGIVLNNDINALDIELAECQYEVPAAPALDGQFLTDLTAANLAVTDAEVNYLTGYLYIPAWWTQLQTTIDSLNTAKNLSVGDTVTSYGIWKPLRDLIDGGTDDLDALIVDQNDSITAATAAIAGFAADTVQAHLDIDAAEAAILVQEGLIAAAAADTLAAFQADSLAQVAIDNIAIDSAAMADESALLTQENLDLGVQNGLLIADTITWAGLRDANLPPNPLNQALADFYQGQIDAADATITANLLTIAANTITISNNTANITLLSNTRAAKNAAKALTATAYADSLTDYATVLGLANTEIGVQNGLITDYNTAIADAIGFIATEDGKITTAEGLITGLEGDIVTRLANIALAEVAIVDAYSNYLHTLTFVGLLDDDIAAAELAKEDRRTEYETYMEAAFDTYLAGLVADAAAAQTAYDNAVTAQTTAMTEWTALNAPCVAIQTLITAKGAELTFGATILALYQTAADYHGTSILTLIEGNITTKEGEIVTAAAAIVTAEELYVTKKIDYDEFMLEMESLNQELLVTQAMVATAKELLDAALAAL